ncbi:MAG: DUF4838 domain-containing protein [Prosthecobacter sp.]|uniref:DUF4838 domain-containing protein n=1 Tax=Prosthecobacter sp. TaxID=1965333 RepID=UPI0039015037
MKTTLALLAILFALVCQPLVAAEPPLRITPENTVILDGSYYPGQVLQYYLIRGCVGAEAARPYLPDAKIDRAVAPHFPVLADKAGLVLPEGKLVLAVGNSRFLTAEDKAKLEANPGAILLSRRGNVVVIAGNPFTGQNGTTTAISEFLDVAAGIRFYAPSELWHSRPKGGVIEIGALDLFRKEHFKTSFFAPFWKDHAEWLRMNQNGSRMTLQCFHNLANVFPPEKYGATHPEIYELRGGERRVPVSIGTKIWNPCLSAPALPDLAMDYIREQMRARPSLTYVSMGMMDIAFECQCESCQASVKKHGSYSQLYFHFVNEVARRSRKEFPNLAITCFSYVNARRPPTGIKFEPNVAVKLVTKSYTFLEPEAAKAQREAIMEFSNAGAGWFFHDWRFAGVTPRNDMPVVADFLRWAAEHRCLGAYIEYSPEQNYYLDGAYYWILMRLMSDPFLDVKKLWTQYCNDMFGAGAEQMLAFYQHFETKHATALQHLALLGDMPRQEPALYSAEDVAWERKTLEQAIAMTKDDAQLQERLAQVMRHFRAHELFALATHKAYQLDRAGTGTGINAPLLAYYLNDDGSAMAEAVRYFEKERNIPPATGDVEMRLGYLPTVIANYSKGIGSLLTEMGKQARTAVSDTLPAAERAAALRTKSLEILRANLPAKSRPDRVQFFEQLLDKAVPVPRTATMPKLDGVLDDAEWEKAARIEGFTIRSSILPSKHATRARLFRVGDQLVIGITCDQVGPIWAETPRDTLTGTHIWRESGVEIMFGSLDPKATPVGTGQYDINALGAFRGFAIAKDNREGVQCAVRLDEAAHRFVIEASLPLKAPGYDYTGLRELNFNIVRMIYTRNSYGADELLNWHPTSLGTIVFE